MFQVAVKGHFDAAHYLREYSGKCSRIHGHTWYYEICLIGKDLNNGMLVDFVDVKAALGMLEDDFLDHRYLNHVRAFQTDNPTAENIAKFIYQVMKLTFINPDVRLLKVIVWESPECSATYWEE